MPNNGPSEKTTNAILTALREKGALGATSRELMAISGSYREAIIKLQRQGHNITTMNANMPVPYRSVNRYTLNEPAKAEAAASGEA